MNDNRRGFLGRIAAALGLLALPWHKATATAKERHPWKPGQKPGWFLTSLSIDEDGRMVKTIKGGNLLPFELPSVEEGFVRVAIKQMVHDAAYASGKAVSYTITDVEARA